MASSTNGKKNQQESDTEADRRRVNEGGATLGSTPLPDTKKFDPAELIGQTVAKSILAREKKGWAEEKAATTRSGSKKE